MAREDEIVTLWPSFPIKWTLMTCVSHFTRFIGNGRLLAENKRSRTRSNSIIPLSSIATTPKNFRSVLNASIVVRFAVVPILIISLCSAVINPINLPLKVLRYNPIHLQSLPPFFTKSYTNGFSSGNLIATRSAPKCFADVSCTAP